MKTFDDLRFEPVRGWHSYLKAGLFPVFSLQAKMFFHNGYGVSVLEGPEKYYGYGVQDRLEVAVLKGDEQSHDLCYDTHITNDVIKAMSEDEITSIMKMVQEL